MSSRRSSKGQEAKLLEQEKLLPFLRDPRSYPRHPKRVRLIQTHASFAFLADPFVYKIKKPVNFGFLDFSTLERRRHYCEREVALNRRLSPEMYLGVVPIAALGGGFTFGDGEGVVEYAVKMRKLSKRHFLDRKLRRNDVDRRDIDRIVERLKGFYLAQHPTEEIEEWGRIDRLKVSTEENFKQTEEFVGRAMSKAAFDAIRFYTNEFFARHEDLFASRIREQWIRDCHGDLRLEHIHLTPRELNIYDCIEFNDRFRYVDVANDVAFLAMDFDFQSHGELGAYFTGQMAKALKDPGMGRLMDFYKCYRAYVRGKVESFHSVAHAATDDEKAKSADLAGRYFRLGLKYAVSGSGQEILVVMGRIASGKSRLAKALAHVLGWSVYSSDVIRKDLADVTRNVRSDAATRRRLYSKSMTGDTYDRLFDLGFGQAKSGGGAILDATFSSRARRDELRKRAKKQGARIRFIEATAPDELVKGRLRERGTATDEASDARLEDYDKLNRRYSPPDELPESQRIRVETTAPIAETVNAVFNALSHHE